ncbi:type I secretion C-terminal target domain-containing protein [Thalassotalea piscium]
MGKIQQLVLFISLVISGASFGQENPFKAVQDLFSAMSAVDHVKMQTNVTRDFQLLEVGEVWDLEDLINVVNPSEYTRRNYFNVISTKINDNTAWVSYWNKATFTKGDIVETVVWLESAVLIKNNNNWKVQMLHSSKITPEKLPKDVILTEYKQ